MINPETLDLSTLPWLPLEEKSAFPKQSAIYFAIDSQGDIQYIGRSVNVKQRWMQHHKFDELQAIGGVRIAYLFLDADLLSIVEAALIEWFHPPLNERFARNPIKNHQKKEGKMYVSIDVSKWYPKDSLGNFMPINAVFESIKGTSNEVGRYTLALALDGVYCKGEFENQVKLARLCSEWSGEIVTVDDLMVIED